MADLLYIEVAKVWIFTLSYLCLTVAELFCVPSGDSKGEVLSHSGGADREGAR